MVKSFTRYHWAIFAVFTIFVITRVLDDLSTWYGNPDLSQEVNPLYLYFGGGWAYIIISDIIVVLFVGASMVLYSNQSKDHMPSINLTFKEYLLHFTFSSDISKKNIVNIWPTASRSALSALFICIIGIDIASWYVIISNMCVAFWNQDLMFIPFIRTMIVINAICIALSVIPYYWMVYYLLYKR